MIRGEGLEKTYRRGGQEVRALRGVDVEIGTGEFVFVIGPSGSGKSTLLHVFGALDRPTAGRVLFDGQDLAALADRDLSLFRRRRIGFVFQAFNLVGTLNAVENVLMPVLPEGLGPDRVARAKELLSRVGLSERTAHRPGELSGGEQQRVAVARAFMNSPAVILADEPTGELDSKTGLEVLATIRRMNAEQGTTVVLVTHNQELLAPGDRVLSMRDGKIVEDRRVPAKSPDNL
ncbi:MAG: ABC transporter ATP-binding protein [Planctomycetes bacterium]|nr:ABC transporter ATP-binding protein [Planctomycetota bacterium]